MTVAERSSREWPASDKMASDPVSRPTMPFAAVSPADAAIEPSATFSLSFILLQPRFRGAEWINFSGSTILPWGIPQKAGSAQVATWPVAAPSRGHSDYLRALDRDGFRS